MAPKENWEMCRWVNLAILLSIVPGAQAQLYLITGSFNDAWNERFASSLYAVSRDGKVTNKETLVSQQDGFFWIGISYEMRQAALLVPGDSPSVRFLDLETAQITKECKFPSLGMGWKHWLADIPGQGASLEILYVGKNLTRFPFELYTMSAEPATPCDAGFKQAPLQQNTYTAALGTAGVRDFTMSDGFDVGLDRSGNVSQWTATTNIVPLGFKVPDGVMPKNIQRVFVHAR